MAHQNLEINTSFLATKEKLPDRFLFVGKIEKSEQDQGFLFYLFEILSPWSQVSKVKKTALDVFEKRVLKDDFSEDFFENVLNDLNISLGQLAATGENEWVGNIHAIIGLYYENNILVTQSGKTSGYLFRGGKISTLTENNTGGKAVLQIFSDIVSGELRAEDKIIFGNYEFFNHISLDRVRRVTENLSARESMLDLYRDLRKFKIKDVNAIIIEAKDVQSAEEETTSDIPEVLYLDQKKESIQKILKKHLGPAFSLCVKYSGKYLKKAGRGLKKHGGAFYQSSKNFTHEKLAPKTKELIQKGKGKAGEMIAPQINKLSDRDKYKHLHVKTNNYAQKGHPSGVANFFSSAAAILINFIRLISQKENRKYLYIGLIIIFVLFGYLKIRANNIHHSEIKEQEEISFAYDKAKEAYEAGKEEVALGKSDGTKKFEEALLLAITAEKSPKDKEKAEELEVEIRKALDKIEKITRFYNATPVFKLADGATHLALLGQNLFGINSEGKIYSGTAAEKEAALLGSIGQNSGQIVDFATQESENKLYIATDKNLVFVLDAEPNTVSELKLSEEEGWENARAIDSYVSNLYVLDRDDNSVMKHTKNDITYSKGSVYINAKKAGLADTVDLAVDGNIYVLSSDGSLKKFSRGTLDANFALKNIPGSESKIYEPKKVVTNADTTYIYILDSKDSKIVRFNKNGEFVSQYAIDKVNIDDFVINDKIKKGYILSSGNIYEFDL